MTNATFVVRFLAVSFSSFATASSAVLDSATILSAAFVRPRPCAFVVRRSIALICASVVLSCDPIRARPAAAAVPADRAFD